MVPERRLERTEHGLLPVGEDGWYVINAREAEWREHGLGKWPRLEGSKAVFPQLGLGIQVLEPGQAMTRYHWEIDQEDFLILAGEALAIVEGEERPLRRWDLLHCPPGTRHAIVGAGDGPCIVFAVGSRVNHTERNADGEIQAREGWGAYPVDETALRRGAGVEEETTDGGVAYASFADPVTTRYRDPLLPG